VSAQYNVDLSAAHANGIHPVFPFPILQFEVDDSMTAWEKVIKSAILPSTHVKPIPLDKMLQ
jgi:hypothetical protein